MSVELVSSGWHVLSAALMFVVGGVASVRIGALLHTSNKRALGLYLWHTLFCFVYIFYVINSGGDALTYYRASLSGNIDFSFGTAAVETITAFFSTVLGLSLLGTFLGYNLIGALGLLAFDAALQAETADRRPLVRRLATFIVVLPSVSFWSSAIGKDSMALLAAGLALWAALALKRRAWLMLAAIALMLLVRPHIAALMVGALALSMIGQRRIGLAERFAIGGIALVLAVVLVPVAMTASGLRSDAGVADVTEYIDNRQNSNMEGGGGVDISHMALPLKLFTYLFRPMPYEAHNLPALAASIDNVALLLLVLAGLPQLLKRRTRGGRENRAFLWLYALSAWLLLALTTANLGISVRQKWMFAPMLIFLMISAMGHRTDPRLERRDG